MKIVALRIRRPENGEAETIARIYLAPGATEVTIEPVDPNEEKWVRTLLARGGVVDARGRSLSTADGQRYVNALPTSFRGSRLWAEELKEEGQFDS